MGGSFGSARACRRRACTLSVRSAHSCTSAANAPAALVGRHLQPHHAAVGAVGAAQRGEAGHDAHLEHGRVHDDLIRIQIQRLGGALAADRSGAHKAAGRADGGGVAAAVGGAVGGLCRERGLGVCVVACWGRCWGVLGKVGVLAALEF